MTLAASDGSLAVTGIVAAAELDELGLEAGAPALALIKATDVLVRLPE